MGVKSSRVAITGNQALAHAVRLAGTQVVAAYPITPQTSVVEEIAEFCASGRMEARFIQTESEHSSMATCIGASMTGARVFTATSSQGLALMHETLHWAAGARTPVVMGEVNRSLAAPWTILSDQSDSMAQRDTGWMQFYCASNQEVLDTTLLAFKVTEQVLLPAMIVLDAFVLSHCVEAVEMPDKESVDEFLPPREMPVRLDPAEPHAFGGMMFPDSFMEQRVKIQQAMEISRRVILDEAAGWEKLTGRSLKPLHEYRTGDAEVVTLCLGTAAGAMTAAVDRLREEGIKAGAIRLWQYRPFPVEPLREALRHIPKIGVIDRACSFGLGGPVGSEVKSVLQSGGAKEVYGFIAGLGGREIRPTSVEGIFRRMLAGEADPDGINWVEVRR